jgi:hypothetical protein
VHARKATIRPQEIIEREDSLEVCVAGIYSVLTCAVMKHTQVRQHCNGCPARKAQRHTVVVANAMGSQPFVERGREQPIPPDERSTERVHRSINDRAARLRHERPACQRPAVASSSIPCLDGIDWECSSATCVHAFDISPHRQLEEKSKDQVPRRWRGQLVCLFARGAGLVP